MKMFLHEALSNAALTGKVFELVHCGEDRRFTVLQEEDDQECQSVVVEQRTGTTGITYRQQSKYDGVINSKIKQRLVQCCTTVYTGQTKIAINRNI